MRVESVPTPTPAMLAVHFPPRHTLQTFQPQERSRACGIPLRRGPVRPGTLENSRLCGAERELAGHQCQTFGKVPLQLVHHPARQYVIKTVL